MRPEGKPVHDDEDGFATAQFAVLMILTIMLLATFVNILLIENMRTTTLTSLRDAARAGTRVVDLRRVAETTQSGDDQIAIDECVSRLKTSMKDLNPSLNPEMSCSIEHDTKDGRDRYFIKASVSGNSGVALVPWATPFGKRLDNLSATHVPNEAAR